MRVRACVRACVTVLYLAGKRSRASARVNEWMGRPTDSAACTRRRVGKDLYVLRRLSALRRPINRKSQLRSGYVNPANREQTQHYHGSRRSQLPLYPAEAGQRTEYTGVMNGIAEGGLVCRAMRRWAGKTGNAGLMTLNPDVAMICV